VERSLRPVGSFLIKLFLSIVTLGIESARDSVYRQAAFGFRERSGDLLLVFLAVTILFTPIFFWVALSSIKSDGMKSGGMKSGGMKSGGIVKTWRRISHVLLVGLALPSSILFVQLTMSVYSNRIVANFHRILAIAAPHISSEQRSIYMARFAKVRTRRDFMTLFEELNLVLENNGEPRSDFSPW
jgi:hypothetical protein